MGGLLIVLTSSVCLSGGSMRLHNDGDTADEGTSGLGEVSQ